MQHPGSCRAPAASVALDSPLSLFVEACISNTESLPPSADRIDLRTFIK